MTLTAYLTDQGYQRVPLTRSGVGHFHAEGTLNDRSVAVLIDTGAASTVVSLALAREIGTACNLVHNKGGGAGGVSLDIYHLPGATLQLGPVKPRITALYAMDLGNVNEALLQKGDTAVEVILGADVLDTHAAVIDYASSSFFLKV